MKTIMVAQGLCAPIRNTITGTLRPYGVRHEVIELPDHEASCWGQVACVRVNDQAVKWAEYLLLRSGRYQLLSKPFDPRNEHWAMRWGGKMPQPWVERGCKVEPPKPKGTPRQGWFSRLFGG